MNNRTTCFCPPECRTSAQCGQNAICMFNDGNCGRGAVGYCLSLAEAAEWKCLETPVCGCDGKLYANTCAAIVAGGVAPSAASTSNCAAEPLPCSDPPRSAPAVACYGTQYCGVWITGGSVSESCGRFDASCAQPSCACLPHNQAICQCEQLPSGLVRLTCSTS